MSKSEKYLEFLVLKELWKRLDYHFQYGNSEKLGIENIRTIMEMIDNKIDLLTIEILNDIKI